MEASLLLTTLSKLIGAGIQICTAHTTEGVGTAEIKAFQGLMDAGGGIAKLWGTRGRGSKFVALHDALITRTFGVALGRYWGSSPRLKPGRSRLGHVTDLVFDPERAEHKKAIDLRLHHIARDLLDPVSAGSAVDELAALQDLTATPLKNPYYQELWKWFSRPVVPGPEGDEIWDFAIENRSEFERCFRCAYIEALATPQGAELQQWLLGICPNKRHALRRILAEDMAAWGQRYVFGNARAQPANDPLPFLTPDNSYVEPHGKIDGANDECNVLDLIREQLQKHPIVVVKADFGHGKSLTARYLARGLAQDWLAHLKPSVELHYPVFIRCARDLRDPRYDHNEVVRRALWNHTKELFSPAPMSDTMFAPPEAEQAAVFFLDGLDEVALTSNQLEDLFARLAEALGPRQRAVIFTRPGVLTGQQNRVTLVVRHKRGKAEARSPRSVRQYVSRHRSRQRRIAPWIAIKVMLFSQRGFIDRLVAIFRRPRRNLDHPLEPDFRPHCR